MPTIYFSLVNTKYQF